MGKIGTVLIRHAVELLVNRHDKDGLITDREYIAMGVGAMFGENMANGKMRPTDADTLVRAIERAFRIAVIQKKIMGADIPLPGEQEEDE